MQLWKNWTDINRAWENIREHIKTSGKWNLGHHKLKQHKPWLDKECLKLLDQRKQAKLQWLQNPAFFIPRMFSHI
jgi:hypothetical protein